MASCLIGVYFPVIVAHDDLIQPLYDQVPLGASGNVQNNLFNIINHNSKKKKFFYTYFSEKKKIIIIKYK